MDQAIVEQTNRSVSRPAGMALSIEQLNACYGRKQALFDINLTVPPLSVTALIGPSGSGSGR